MIDGEAACRDKLRLVLAADQRPFEAGNNRFCVLQPLATLEGDDVATGVAAFPNRGRVWWMLRDAIRDDAVVPGSIWISTIESATKFDIADPESDRFQVNRADIQPDDNNLYEIIDLPDVDDPDLSIVTRGQRIQLHRKPVGRVFLRGQKTSLGPLKAIWHAASSEVEVQPLILGKPEVIRVESNTLNDLAKPVTHRFSIGQFDPQSSVEPFRVTLIFKQRLKLDELRDAGSVLDASLDSQVINWALKTYGITRATGQSVKTFFSEIAASSVLPNDDDPERKLGRLRQLAKDSEAVRALGERIAAEIVDCGFFKELVETHIASVTARRVAEQVQLRESEIESAVEDQQRQLRAVRSDLARLSTEFEKKARQQDEELKQRHSAYVEQIEKRELAVATREEAAAKQEADVARRLERLIERYTTEANRVADDLLLQLPLLQKISGHDNNGDATRTRGSGSAVTKLKLPDYVDVGSRKATTSVLTEEEFLRQFERVVRLRGFQFATDDLKNFHTCVKIGGLTVLAGPSGTGKSSLARLYAEALGWPERYQHISVRPDWLDDRDFVGAFNPLVRRFEPSNSGVVDHLVAALVDQERELGGIFLLALDEMNLARVEHYFAQFLSVLELPAANRVIPLFSQGVAPENDPYEPYRELRIADNVRFVGTVNIDETTHFFSPKVLDRTQVVSLPTPDLTNLQTASFSDPIPGINAVRFETYREWGSIAADPEELRNFLREVSESLKASRLELRARQFKRILQYVSASSQYMPRDTALDFQLVQVVFPRLRRTAPRFDESLAKLRAIVKRERFPRSAELLERISESGTENEFFQLL